MYDIVTFAEGERMYRVTGLDAKARAISGASQEMDILIADRLHAAETALATWRGPHAATFSEDVNTVLAKMAALRIALWRASNVVAAFPETPATSLSYMDSIYLSARVEPVPESGTTAAEPGQLRAYVTVASGQDERFVTLADAVNLDGVSAEVSYPRSLNATERGAQFDAGVPLDIIDQSTVTETEPVADVGALIPEESPTPDVPALTSASRQVSEFTTAVASAFEDADEALLEVLAEHPELIEVLLPGIISGQIDGEAVQAMLGQMAWVEEDPARWGQLTPVEQQVLIEYYPAQVGSLDGIPIVARDQANRIVLDETREHLEARLQNLRELGGPDDQIGDIERKLNGITTIEERLAGSPGWPEAYLVGFSAEGQGGGRAIVAIGNPDYADNVATFVPGTGSWLGRVRGGIRRSDLMAVDAFKASGEDTSVIMWLGYDAPPDREAATDPEWAAGGADALRSFQTGLDISHTRGGANNTVIGHSYGTTVIGHAATGGDLDADNLILIASPGVGADHVSDLGLDSSRVYATTAANDPIRAAPTAVLGPQPVSPSFGAQVFPSDPGSSTDLPPNVPFDLPALETHSEYWDQDNVARDNMAAIIAGNYDQVEVLPEPRLMGGP